MSAEDDFGLRPLRPEDTFASIRAGHASFAPLKQFARQRAKKYELANLARTYVVSDRGVDRIVAYVTLVCSEVLSKAPLIHGEDIDFPYKHWPAVKIARLLVDARYRDENRRGLGRMLVDLTLGIARSEICPAVGCRFVVVDAKADSTAFYKKCGFTAVDTLENRSRAEKVMYIDLHKAGS